MVIQLTARDLKQKIANYKKLIIMRKLLTTIFLLAPLSIMMGCNGDHSDRTVRDTAKNVHDSLPSNIDTSKTTTATGDAGTLDNSTS